MTFVLQSHLPFESHAVDTEPSALQPQATTFSNSYTYIVFIHHTQAHLIAIGRRYKRRSVATLAVSERQQRLGQIWEFEKIPRWMRVREASVAKSQTLV